MSRYSFFLTTTSVTPTKANVRETATESSYEPGAVESASTKKSSCSG